MLKEEDDEEAKGLVFEQIENFIHANTCGLHVNGWGHISQGENYEDDKDRRV